MSLNGASGLRQWERDPGLVALGGDGALEPPDSEELAELVRVHLLRDPQGVSPERATWHHARWKPGVSLTCVFAIEWDDGAQSLVTFKRYAGDKARALAERSWKPTDCEDPRLLARAVLPDGVTVLCPLESDRVLELRHLLEPRRLASFASLAGLVASRTVRRRRTSYRLLRYKPEHRAVYRVGLHLRSEDPGRLVLAARVLPPGRARVVIDRRLLFQSCGGEALALPLAAHCARRGLLLEPWREPLSVPSPGDFSDAEAAGELLARLHGLDFGPAGARRADTAASCPDELFRRFDGLPAVEWAQLTPGAGAAERQAWTHGDLHPDQIARPGGEDAPERLLMDLDDLHVGDRDEDLASWIADGLHDGADDSYAAVSGPLLAGYAAGGGRVPGEARLRALVAAALVERGAGSIRRLEAGALERAARALQLARALARGGLELRPS